ncbi:MAG: hemolysin family protein [Planctomycetota bacterium]
MTLLFVYVGFALGISFLCSLLEAALLSVKPVVLMHKRDAGSRGAARLLQIKTQRIDDALAAILTLNTVSNTAGAALAGNQARVVLQGAYSDHVEMGVSIFTAVLTICVLFLAEIPPKTLGAVYSSQIATPVGWLLHYLVRLLYPVVTLTRVFTRLLTPDEQAQMSRRELMTFIAMAAKDGTIALREHDVLDNLLRFREISVADVMTPRTVAVMLPDDTPSHELISQADVQPFSRIPLYREDRDNVVAYVLQRDVLVELARGAHRDRPLAEFGRNVWFVPEVASMFDALQQFLERREQLAIVTDEHGGVSGLVTLEDLMETILGVEILDESDRHADLRQVATRLREQRLERLRSKLHRPADVFEPGSDQRPDGVA